MNANILSVPQQLDQGFGYSVQAIFTTSGTLAGTFKLQASLDYQRDPEGNVTNAGTWTDLANTSNTIAAAGSLIWNQPDVMYPWVRIVYTKAVGDTGTLNAFLFERAF